ncbi:MAG: hypothetical protein IPJ37_21780 [Bacteroidales bacterium]|nr:hypothetical protein [Bacteroidales bacterium]
MFLARNQAAWVGQKRDRFDGIDSVGPFHPEVIWPNKNKNAAVAAFCVF